MSNINNEINGKKPFVIPTTTGVSAVNKSPHPAITAESRERAAKPGDYIFIAHDMPVKDDNDEMNTAGSLHEVLDVGDKNNIYCPFPDHLDNNPSAFVEKKTAVISSFFAALAGKKASILQKRR